MIEALMRYSQPFHLIRQPLIPILSQYLVVYAVQFCRILIDDIVIVVDWRFGANGRHHSWRSGFPSSLCPELSPTVTVKLGLVLSLAGCAKDSGKLNLRFIKRGAFADYSSLEGFCKVC